MLEALVQTDLGLTLALAFSERSTYLTAVLLKKKLIKDNKYKELVHQLNAAILDAIASKAD